MPEFRTHALVLRTFDQGESDRLVHLFTESHGRVSAIAKGARRSRRRFPGKLEILNRLEVQLVDPPRASLMRIDGARLVAPYEHLAADLARYAIACQLLEILDRLTMEHEANPGLLHFSCGVLDVLAEERADRLFALLVLTKTLARLGYRPQLAECTVCGVALDAESGAAFEPRQGGGVCDGCAEPDADRVPVTLLAGIELGIRTPLRERDRLGIAPAGVQLAERLLERFFRFHVGLELRTQGFLRQVVPFSPLPNDSVDAETGTVDTPPASSSTAARPVSTDGAL